MLIVLRVNEAQHVRMRDAHHAHVRAAPHAALLHHVGHLVDDVHEGDRPGGDAVRRTDHRAAGTQQLISHAVPPPV